MSEQFSNPEQALIERLRRAPQPELSSEAREMIRVRLLDALDHPPMPAPRPRYFHPVVVIAAVLIVGGLITSGILFVLSRQNQVESLPTATLAPTNTIEPTVTAIPTTVVPAVVSSPVLLPTASPTFTPTVTAVASPTLLPTATVPVVIVIQGPVEKIDGNVVTIYGIQVQIPPNDPILITVKVGDILRVEGNQTGTTQIIIVATTVTIVDVTENADGSATGGSVNPPSSGASQGEVWTDDGTCAHPPPDWAPANGWRRRCQGQTNNNNGNNGNNNGNGNNGNGNGNGHGGKPNKPKRMT